MANKFKFKEVEIPAESSFKDKRIVLEKTVRQSEEFSIAELESQMANMDSQIESMEASKAEIQAKIDAATAALNE